MKRRRHKTCTLRCLNHREDALDAVLELVVKYRVKSPMAICVRDWWLVATATRGIY